jgi:hypothetical protein
MAKRQKNLNAAASGGAVLVGVRCNANLQDPGKGHIPGRFQGVQKHAGGRPSYEPIAVRIFDKRRKRGVRLPGSKLDEARAIHKEMAKRLSWLSDPYQRPVTPETIAAYGGIRTRWKSALARH